MNEHFLYSSSGFLSGKKYYGIGIYEKKVMFTLNISLSKERTRYFGIPQIPYVKWLANTLSSTVSLISNL